MTSPSLPEIDSTGISPMGLSNPLSQRIFGFRNEDQVNVVRHQTICPDLDCILKTPLGHQGNIFPVVIFAEKGQLPPVAALSNRVWNSYGYHSSNARAPWPRNILINCVWCHSVPPIVVSPKLDFERLDKEK